MASSIAIEAPAQNGLIGLADSIAMSKPTTSFWQVKPAAIIHRIRDYRATIAAVQPVGFESATGGEDTTFQPSEEACQKADYLSRSAEAKNWE
jgi:hypothetical protein